MSGIRNAVMALLLLGLAAPAQAQNCYPVCDNGELNLTRFLNPPPGTTYTPVTAPAPFANSTHGWLRKLFYEPPDPAYQPVIRFATPNGTQATLADIVNTDLAARHAGQPTPAGQVVIRESDVQAQADRISATEVSLDKH